MDIPNVVSYNYLGCVIDANGKMEEMFKKISKRENYILNKMRYYSSKLSFQNQYLLWSIYVKPYYSYIAPIIPLYGKTLF